MTDTKPKPLTPAQRRRKAKDLLRRCDELVYLEPTNEMPPATRKRPEG